MVELTLRVVVSLGVVLGIFWAVARAGSRRLGGQDRALVRVRSRQSLSRGSSLAVVEIGTRVLVVGVSDNGVRLLTEMAPEELSAPQVVESVVDTVAELPAGVVGEPEFRSYADYQDAAFRQAADASYRAHALDATPASFAPATPAPAPAAPAAAPSPAPAPVGGMPAGTGALAGSLLSASTWRQAWQTAAGRAPRVSDRDAA